MPYLIFAVVCAIWGASFILMKKAGLVFNSIDIGVWRVVGGAAVLVLIAVATGRRWRVERRYLGWLVLAALISYAWPYSIQPYLVTRHGSGFIGMTVSFTPLLTVLVGIPMLGIYPSARQVVGVLGGLFFLGLIMADGLSRDVPWYDLLLAISVPACYAVGNSLIRRRLANEPALALTASALAFTGMVLIPLAAFAPLVRPDAAAHTGATWTIAIVSSVVLGTLGTGLATYLFNRLIQEQGPLFAGMVTYVVPIGALIWGWADTEVVTPLQIIALAGVLVMVAVVQYGAAVKPADSSALPHSGDEIV
ncbi:MAG: DMT family transporter [Planctomycetota bacterium]|nr:DMT family transporter [Planctomycetota bacterium]